MYEFMINMGLRPEEWENEYEYSKLTRLQAFLLRSGPLQFFGGNSWLRTVRSSSWSRHGVQTILAVIIKMEENVRQLWSIATWTGMICRVSREIDGPGGEEGELRNVT